MKSILINDATSSRFMIMGAPLNDLQMEFLGSYAILWNRSLDMVSIFM